MKKIIALLLACVRVLALAACGKKDETPVEPEATPGPEIVEPVEQGPEELDEIDKLADAALDEKELKLISSCGEDVTKTAAEEFEAIFGIHVTYQCMSVEDAAAAIESGSDADVWMGVPSAILDKDAAKGLFLPYTAENSGKLLSDSFKGTDGSWYGIYADLMGFTYNREIFADIPELIPTAWGDLYKDVYVDQLCASLTDGNAAAAVASGEYAIAVGRVSYGVARALGGSNLDFAVPSTGLQCMVVGTAILKDCAHENAAKQWIEFMLTDFADGADLSHMGLFPVIADAATPAIAAALGIDIASAKVVPVTGNEGLVELVELLKQG